MEGERKRRWWPLIVVGLLVLYPLSMGPFFWLYTSGTITAKTYTTLGSIFYAPIWWLYNNNEFVHGILYPYLMWWW
jgi:hypothetical protein